MPAIASHRSEHVTAEWLALDAPLAQAVGCSGDAASGISTHLFTQHRADQQHMKSAAIRPCGMLDYPRVPTEISP